MFQENVTPPEIATAKNDAWVTATIIIIKNPYPSSTSFSNGAFWSQTGQIQVVFLYKKEGKK